MSSIPQARHATVALAPPAVAEIAQALEAFCTAEQVPPETAWRLKVALDEIVANIVSYGATTGHLGTIDVWFERTGDTVEVRIADDGVPFDPLDRPPPDVTSPLDERQPGGLGIALVRSLMDEVHYERTSRNMLRLRRRFDPGTDPGQAQNA